MRMRGWKLAVLGMGVGTLFQFGGCTGQILQDVLINAVTEFIWDNDTVFDFFGDDAPGQIV